MSNGHVPQQKQATLVDMILNTPPMFHREIKNVVGYLLNDPHMQKTFTFPHETRMSMQRILNIPEGQMHTDVLLVLYIQILLAVDVIRESYVVLTRPDIVPMRVEVMAAFRLRAEQILSLYHQYTFPKISLVANALRAACRETAVLTVI